MFKQKSIIEILKSKTFTISAEIFPPRNGRPPSIIMEKLDALSKMPIDFISVTKGAMGSMRGGTVPIGYMIPERYGMNALVHFRCRDMNRREVENLLVDHMYFGTRNILAILGDPLPGEHSIPINPETHHRYASELVQQISDMNSGLYLPLKPGGASREGMKTDFCVGVACYPEAEDMKQELFVMGEKVNAGAKFAITQMVFDADDYGEYVDALRSAGIGIPIIPGIRPVSSMEHVEAAEKNFGATVPDSLKARLQSSSEELASAICLEFTLELIRNLRDMGAPGVHMFTLNDIDIIKTVMGAL
ncbi:MAG: methylenetetrahydrofolate reductase [Thermoplasmata archaeon]